MHNAVQLFWQSYLCEFAMFACVDDQHNNGEQRQDCEVLCICCSVLQIERVLLRWDTQATRQLASVSIKPDNKERLDHRYWQLYRNSIVLRIALPLLELHVARANMRARSWPPAIIYANYVSFDVFAVANENIFEC